MFPSLTLYAIVKSMNFKAVKEKIEKWNFQTGVVPTILRVILVPVIFKLSFKTIHFSSW